MLDFGQRMMLQNAVTESSLPELRQSTDPTKLDVYHCSPLQKTAIGPRLNNSLRPQLPAVSTQPEFPDFRSPCTNGASPAIKDAEGGNVVVEFCFRALVV